MSWEKYVGRRVEIEWIDPNDDWPYFRVIRVVDTTHRVALLRGIDYPDGSCKHDGNIFRARFDEVRKIKMLP
jgi:hypothetical protein